MKPTWQERLNAMSEEDVQEALRQREAYIKAKETPVIELNEEMSYRCVDIEDYCNKPEQKGYILQYKWWQDDEWNDVTDLTEMKVWEYNDLVSKIQKHYPDYPIEHLEGRFV